MAFDKKKKRMAKEVWKIKRDDTGEYLQSPYNTDFTLCTWGIAFTAIQYPDEASAQAAIDAWEPQYRGGIHPHKQPLIP